MKQINLKKGNWNYLQKSNRIVSNTRTGPVLPRIVKGWPLNKPYKMPQIAPDSRLSIAA